MPSPNATPDLQVTTYHGSPMSFTLVPSQNGQPVSNLSSYSQIDFSWYSGNPGDPGYPGTKKLDLRYTGTGPLYITITTVVINAVSFPAVTVTVPGSVMGGVGLPPGLYTAEMWLTPPGGEATYAGKATFNHLPTSK